MTKLKTLKDIERTVNRTNDIDILRFNYSDKTWYELNLLPIFLDIGRTEELEINIVEQICNITEEDLK